MRFLLACLALLSVLLSVGCGGEQAAEQNQWRVTPEVSVRWGARTRAIEAPPSADVVAFIFVAARPDGSNLEFWNNRNQAVSSEVITYTAPESVAVGKQRLIIGFYTNTFAGIQLVAKLEMQVLVRSNGSLARTDGTPLGTITPESEIASVQVPADQPIALGQQTFLYALAFNKQGEMVVPASTAFFWEAKPSGIVTVEPTGEVFSNNAGEFEVRTTLDGVTSPWTKLKVVSPSFRRVDIRAGELVADRANNRLFASDTEGTSVAVIDVTSGAITQRIEVGTAPNQLAISTDGSMLYVGVDGDNGYRAIHTSTLTVDPLVSFGSSASAVDLAVQPGDASALAVILRGLDQPRVALYRNGALQPDFLDIFLGPSHIRFNDEGTKLYGSAPFSPNYFDRIRITPTGLALEEEFRAEFSYAVYDMLFAQGKLFLSSGFVIAASDFQTLVQPNMGKISYLALGDRGDRYYAFNWLGTASLEEYDVASMQPIGYANPPFLPSVQPTSFVKVGENDFALASFMDAVYLIDDVVFEPYTNRPQKRTR